MQNYYELLAKPDAELARVDPVVTNLLVAKSIPSLARLDIGRYCRQVDFYAAEIEEQLPGAEAEFWKTPGDWKNDVNFFRLGVACTYLDQTAGIAYNEDQRYVGAFLYTDPSDLFLNGVLDTRRGTCGNMAALHVAIGWRLGWPVSLACVRSHLICRYDDGLVAHNIEATDTGRGGFSSRSDGQYAREYNLSAKALSTGSDLRAVTPREMLGLFVGLRARHMRDCGNLAEAEKDYLLARHLFPANHELYFKAMEAVVRRGEELFLPGEEGSPRSVAEWLAQEYGAPRVRERKVSEPEASGPVVLLPPAKAVGKPHVIDAVFGGASTRE